MLVSLYIRNFGPVGDEPFEFSMETQNGRSKNEEYVVETGFSDSPYLMKVAGIFGANASGKTTIFKAIQSLHYMIDTSHKNDKGDKLPDEVFKLSSLKNDCSVINISFIKNNFIYEYKVSFNKNKIQNEILKKKEKIAYAKWKVIIDRKDKKIHSDLDSFIKLENFDSDVSKAVLLDTINDNNLMLSELHSRDNCDYFNDFINFFNKYKMFEGGGVPIYSSINQIEENKSKVLKLLNVADFGVDDVSYITEETMSYEQVPAIIQKIINDNKEILNEAIATGGGVSITGSDGVSYKIHKDNIEKQSVKFKMSSDGNEHYFSLKKLSSGTNTFFTYACMFVEVLQNGSILFVDELERSLHPYLTNYIVDLFNSKETNPNNAQLIFISHDVSLLDKRTLKPEQVYFTAKDEDTLQSELYSLVEFNIKADRDKSYGRKYLEGAFGAVPNFK